MKNPDEHDRPQGLTITRKHGEAIHITNPETGERITIWMVRRQGKISLVISAPPHWKILRNELE